MVFDWFKRKTAEPQPADAPGNDSEPQEQQGTAPSEQAPSSQPPSPGPASADPSPTPSEAPTPAAGAGAIDADSLAWAREAYARLKAEQAARQAEPVATPSPPPPPAPSPQEVVPSPQEVLEEVVPVEQPLPVQASVQELAPAEPMSAIEGATAAVSPPVPPAPLEAPISLLERAAAERRQRQQELLEVAGPPPIAPVGEPAPLGPPLVADEAEPTLGDFDEAFTWSAEVLAAQGRRVDQVSLEEIDWLARLRRGMEKTRKGFVSQLLERLGDDPLTPELVDDLETTLLRADVGVQATDQVLGALRARLNQEVVDGSEGLRFLKEQLRELLEAPIAASGRELLAPERDRLNIWLLVGVNGVGKTTTLGKLANLAVRSGYTCLIAAADTFRAAAVEQVRIWGERSGVPVISNPSANADPAAVVYDAINSAKAKGTELVLVDTAGRLQTKHNLMEELSKVRRIVDKLAPEAVVESLLVLDSSQGQNGLRQAMAFAEAAGLTGVVITKLDGSSRGGVSLAVCREVGLPIRFIGAGEGLRDLRPFNSFEFVEALLAT